MRWFVRGDIDGFFGLALDNVIQLMLIIGLCEMVLGFPPDLIYGKILPGAAISLLVGNIFYAWQARRIAIASGRTDICALPYGINTVSLFAHIFLVMLPAALSAKSRGLDDTTAATIAWQAGLLACLGSGIIELAGATVAERIRRASPRAALLSTLAGIALGFISFTFLFRTFAFPVVGLVTLGVILLTYFGGVRFRGGIPGGLVAIVLGTALAWGTGSVAPTASPSVPIGFHFPLPVFGDLFAAFTSEQITAYIAVIIPMGVFNVIGSLQNIESAEAAGDQFPTAPSLAVNGLGTIAAAVFGSCFPTTIYIGHPGWKGLGARVGYSILNGVFCTILCVSGLMAYVVWAVPIEAGMAIVLWIGIVITAQAFQATPIAHAPAVVLGLLPGIGAWGVLMAKDGLRAADATFSDALIPKFMAGGTFIHGAFALEQGFIFTAMIFAAVTVHIIERRFIFSAGWCVLAALLCSCGFMHSYVFTPKDSVGAFGTPAWSYAAGYLGMAIILAAARWITEPNPLNERRAP